jgi:hypothetical protein
MQKWNISGTKDGNQFMLTEGGDWGKEVINGVGIEAISNVGMLNGDKNVMFFVRKGVIHIGEQSIKLGVNIGGYAYVLFDECSFDLIDMAPVKTAMYVFGTETNEVLGMHLMVKYNITHLIDKVTKEKTELSAPFEKEILLYLDEYGYLAIC